GGVRFFSSCGRNVRPTRHLTSRKPGSPRGFLVTDTHDVLTALSELARTQRASLAALARSEGLSPEDAVDAVQEALCSLLALARRDALPPDHAEWAPLLAGIARNVARNRRRRHFVALPHDDIDRRERERADQKLLATDEMIARAEDHVRLRACVEEL